MIERIRGKLGLVNLAEMPAINEGCSNMNASSFVTFGTYMLLQNGIRFYKGLYRHQT